jgi:hypothetical protein
VKAEELVLGYFEPLVHAYLSPPGTIMLGSQRTLGLLCATFAFTNSAPTICRLARLAADGFGVEAAIFNELVDLAKRKVVLDHNQFNLKLSTEWLRLHCNIAIAVLALTSFYIAGVLYFVGI